jgi:hypothetical protein
MSEKKLRTTYITGHVVNGKWTYSFRDTPPTDAGERILFRIDGPGGVSPRSAPNPATVDELEEWIAHLREVGYVVISDGKF